MMATSFPLDVVPVTASGFLSLLSEPSPQLRHFALVRLLQVVDTLWHEIANALPELEALSEMEPETDTRHLAAAVASRVFYHLQERFDALRLAVESGDDYIRSIVAAQGKDPYADSLIGAAMDTYITCARQGTHTVDSNKIQRLMGALFQRSFQQADFKHVLGIAVEARDLTLVHQVLAQAQDTCLTPHSSSLSNLYHVLCYAMDIVSSSYTTDDHLSTKFRHSVLDIVAQYFKTLKDETQKLQRFANIRMKCILRLVQIHQRLKQYKAVADILGQLLYTTSEEQQDQDFLLALQISFHIMDSGDQYFVDLVAKHLDPPPSDSVSTLKRDKLLKVLVGGFSAELSLSFLHRYSDSDRLIMENLKKVLEERGGARNSVYHNCAVITHSYLNAGTTNDSFLRDNLDWMKKASHWAKFSTTASLGIVHARHITEAMPILQPYLPPTPDTTSPPVSSTGGFAEGGALYALGIIHGCDTGSCSELRKQTNDLLRSHLRVSHANEAISHGAALGVGLTAMGTNNIDILQELKEVLYTDSAVAGEAAAVAIGLVLVGSGAGNISTGGGDVDSNHSLEISELVVELKSYAKETQHEKIIRGIAIALALINYGQEDNADALIDEMKASRDPIIRYGAQYALGLAYCGTGSNKAIRSLLHTAVSDVNDDVRAAAVIALAFVLFKTPERVPQIVKLLCESFNAHVRYASCMAVGIAMAGTGDAESLSLLEPMLSDMTDFVRQGALLGSSMIYMQQGDTCNGRKILQFREKLSSIIADKHQSLLTKMGAILGTGIIDAGGRNCLLDLGSLHGFTKMTNVVGLALWLQHWHWFPMMHMLSLALTPTITVGLNHELKYPKNFCMDCRSKPSTFAYPKRLEEKKEEKKKRVETVALSVTVKNKARLARKKAKEETQSGSIGVIEEGKTEAMEIEESEAVVTTTKKKREPEPNSYCLYNPCRVTKAQVDYCGFDLTQRYRPVHSDGKPYGVLILTDSKPDETDDSMGTILPPSMGAEDEAGPPEPFEWTPDNI